MSNTLTHPSVDVLIFWSPCADYVMRHKVHVAGSESNNVMEGWRGEAGKSGFIQQNVLHRYQSLKESRAMHAFAGFNFFVAIVKLRVVFADRVQLFGHILACFVPGADWLQKIITAACLIDLLYS
jgi:hypothetical protein